MIALRARNRETILATSNETTTRIRTLSGGTMNCSYACIRGTANL